MKVFLIKLLLLAAAIAARPSAAFSQAGKEVVITISLKDTIQRIRNIGASGCWYSESIGKDWPEKSKNRIAELLFSRSFQKNGQPKGIGLSAFRFNIGAGTAEQGDSSGIKDPAHRVECFRSADGSYDWKKQTGYVWMLQQAKNYGVKDLIAFVNSPPVQFTKNGLGFKLVKDFQPNLKVTCRGDYAEFLTSVIDHFDKAGLHFNYLSPVNEPQWDWSGSMGTAKQEGSPWTNEEIFETISSISASLRKKKLTTQLLMPEAATLNHLIDSGGSAARQAMSFWDPSSPHYVGALSNTNRFVEGHGYFTDNGDGQLISTRSRLRDSLKAMNQGLEYWQSEYCMLGNGYQEKSTEKKRSAIDCALFLAKVIHHDLTTGNATAWHYWNSYEPGAADSNTLYYLIALTKQPLRGDSNSLFTVTKNLWALGHYSLFIRPGMYRVAMNRSDTLSETEAAQDLMVSAFREAAGGRLIVNVINYTGSERKAGFAVANGSRNKNVRLTAHYLTTASEKFNLSPYPIKLYGGKKDNITHLIFPARSVSTLIFSNADH